MEYNNCIDDNLLYCGIVLKLEIICSEGLYLIKWLCLAMCFGAHGGVQYVHAVNLFHGPHHTTIPPYHHTTVPNTKMVCFYLHVIYNLSTRYLQLLLIQMYFNLSAGMLPSASSVGVIRRKPLAS